jgi:hypothetical protein
MEQAHTQAAPLFTQGDRLMIIDGLAGGSLTITAEQIHLDEEVIIYKGKNGEEGFALFEEVIKKL